MSVESITGGAINRAIASRANDIQTAVAAKAVKLARQNEQNTLKLINVAVDGVAKAAETTHNGPDHLGSRIDVRG